MNPIRKQKSSTDIGRGFPVRFCTCPGLPPIRWIALLLGLLTTYPLQAQSPADTVRISLTAISGMQYDVVRFSVRPGSYLRVVLRNRDEMSHNVVFTQPGKRQEIVDAALKLGQDGPKRNYLPDSPQILAAIPVLQPGQTDSVLFRVPRKTGVYPYVCTFPGHGLIMYGALHVTNGVMPAIAYDADLPPGRRKSETGQPAIQTASSGHPYDPLAPYLYRVLMPDAGPAAIAVCLPHEVAYCWDAGACRLRYAWQGGFLDMMDYWTVKGEPHAKILGPIFYRDKTEYPLRIGEPGLIPAVDFKGYRLIDRYPEFHYEIDGWEVFELIHPLPDGSGLIRSFRIPDARQALWFVHAGDDGVSYTASVGKWENERLRLTPEEAKSFTITLTQAKEKK